MRHHEDISNDLIAFLPREISCSGLQPGINVTLRPTSPAVPSSSLPLARAAQRLDVSNTMRSLALHSLCKSLARRTHPSSRQCRKLSVLAQQVERAMKSRPEPIPIQREQHTPQQLPDPFILVASELTHIRNSMLNLLGAAHPGLTGMAEYYFLHPSKQLRSLLVLLFARATNGLGEHWEQKDWDAVCEANSGQAEVLDRPLTLPNILNEWNLSMRDDTPSFESVFALAQSIPRPDPPPLPSSSRLSDFLSPCLASPPTLLPSQIRLAQIVEMIHVASLLHDNIVQSPEEEQEGFGNKLSILGGDFLLGRASTALSRLGESEVVELVASVISNQVEGEFLRMEDVRTPELGLVSGPTTLTSAWELYLRKTYLKTASLMAKGARSAVILGGCQEGDIWKEVAYAYGRNLGIAHQLLEDSDDVKYLKPGLAAAPALFAAEEHPELLPMIRRNFTEPGDAELATSYIRRTSAIERTHLLAQAYANKALEMLHFLPDSESKLGLRALTNIVMTRSW